MVERWQIRKWERPVVLRWFPVDVSCIAFICYSVGVGIYISMWETVCVERGIRRRRRVVSSSSEDE